MKLQLIFLNSLLFIFACTPNEKEKPIEEMDVISLTRYVNPLIGTAQATTQRILGHNTETYAQTIPSVTTPHGMTNWTPQTRITEEKCLAPYYYSDSLISGFRGTHWLNGSCVQDYGSLTVMPLVGETGLLPNERLSAFTREEETASAAKYEVTLKDSGIKVSMTATKRCGFLQFSFPDNETPTVVVEPNSDEHQGFVKIILEKNQIVGYNPVHRIYQGWGKEAGFSGYFVAEFNIPFESSGIYDVSGTKANITEGQNTESLGAYVRFPTGAKEVLLRVGTSFTSLENAEKNLQAEINHWDFNKTTNQLEKTWEDILNRVQVKGDEKDMTIFYTALYHAFQHPRLMSDTDGSYPGFAEDTTIHKAVGFDYYGDFSAWDTYRAVHPLHNLLAPEMSRDFIQSIIAKAEQGEWMPIFPCWNSYTAAMIGDHLASLISDAYVKGIDIPNVETAYQYLKKNAFESPKDFAVYKDGKGRRALESYIKYNYIPMEDSVQEAFHKKEQVSRTLEYAYDDFALAQLANGLGKIEDAKILMERALNYRNIYDPSVGYMRGRYINGDFYEQFEANGNMPYITEGTPKHYSWYVPQDIQGLIELMGGDAAFNAKLDTFFNEGEYWHGNEPCHQTYYLYNYSGEPWKSQKTVRQIIREDYHAGSGGLSGNEDSGQMSAWLVFSAMGFYPVCPGTDEYALISPLFPEVKLNLPNSQPFTISATNHSETSLYIQEAKLDETPFNQAFLTHSQLTQGGNLTMMLDEQPNKQWATDLSARPYSMSRE
ncbi:MAG: GH92 family glycosyl hydrolase [Bacteroidota bacterium]